MAAAKKIFSPDGSPMISTRRAAERLHCAPDYIGKLCREGKLNGTLAEGTWFVELSSIAVFEVERRQLRAARAQKLSETRKEEALSYKFQNGGAITRLALRARRVAPSGAIVALCASLVMGVSLAFASAAVSGPNLSAAIAQINSPFFGPRIQIISLERASDGVLKVFSRFYAFFAPSAPAPLAQFPEDQGDAFKGDSLAREGVALGTKASPLSVPAKPSTIVQNSYPVRERVLERVVEKVSTGVSEDLLTTKLQELGNVLRSELYIGLSNVQAPRGFPSSGGVANNISITQVIDKLDNVTLTSATVRGLSGLSDSDVPDTITASNYLPLAGGALTGAVTNSAVATSTWSGPFAADVLNVSTSTATSTFANGIELAGGCFRLPDGTCAGSGGGVSGGTDGMLASWTGASSLTATSAPTAGYFVATSSTASIFPFASTTGITVAGTASTTNLNISNISACSGGNALVTNSSGVVSCGVITASGGTFPFTPTALGNSTSTLLQLNAGLIALASSTIGAGGQTTGLTVSGGATTTGNQYIAGTLQAGASTLSSLSLTFALSVADGGTGATTLTSGQLLYGAGTNAVQSVATSTLAVGNGLTTTSGTLGYQVGGTNASIGLAAINANSLLANVSAVSAVPTTLATSSLFAAGTPGNVLTYTSAGTWVPSATTTFSTGLTYANGNTTCDTSSSSVFGCLAAVDWSLFNNKISSSSLSAGTGISYNSSTGVISNTIGYPFPNNATTTQLQFNGGASTTLASVYDILYVGRDATTTIRGDGVASVIPFASSTALTVSGNFYGAGLTTCNTTADKLLWNSGIFSCGVDQNSGGAGSEINWTWFNGSGIRLGTTTNQIAIGATATATLAKVEVTPNGSNPAAIFFGDVGIGTSSPGTALGVAGSAVVSGPVTAQYFTATSTATASVLPFASSTALTVSGTGYFGTASTTNLNISSAATFQNLASGGLAVNASGAVYKAATTTFSTGLTYANGNTTCDTASSSVFGCLAAVDWSLFNDKVSSTSIDTSAELAALIGDETGSGALVFGTQPTISDGRLSSTTLSGNSLLSNATTTYLGVTGTATSSFAAGINLTTGCFAINDACVSGGASGSVNAGTAGQISYYAAAGSAISGTSTVFIASNGNVGIGSSTPSAKLAIDGGTILQAAYGSSTQAGSFSTAGHSYNVAVAGRYAYVADYEGGLRILDLTHPGKPSIVGSYTGSNTVLSVVVAGRYAYVGDVTGISILDVSNPASPALLGRYPFITYVYTLALSGKYLYAPDFNSGAMRVIDVSNPTSPTLTGSFSPGGSSAPYSVAVLGKYAYLGDQGNSAIYIVDISNPAAPAKTATYSLASSLPAALYISGKYLYVADGAKGVYVLNVGNPAATPTLAASFDTAGSYYGVAAAGRYVYAADHTGNFAVLDFTASTTLPLVGRYNSGGTPWGIAVAGKYAYMAADAQGLRVIDLNGADLPAASIGSLASNNANISDALAVGGDITAGGGLAVGISGIFSRGAIAAAVASTTQTNPTVASFMGGNVGISTSSPYARLSILADHSEYMNRNLFAVASSTSNGTTTLFSILNSGNVGIGVATPSYALDVSGFINTDQYSGYKQAGNTVLYASSTLGSVYLGGGAGPSAYNANANYNTLLGTNAGNLITSGANNIILGAFSTAALSNLTSGSNNVSIGYNISMPSPTANNQLNIQNIIYGANNAGTAGMPSIGQVGVGSTTPWARFGIHANAGDSNTTLFAIASSTASATTTHFIVTNTGRVGIATASPVAQLSVQGADQLAATKSLVITDSLATELLTVFNNGLTQLKNLLATASSTIGDGTQAGGLTISGGATTTGFLAITGTTGTTTIASGQGFTIGSSQFVLQQGSGNVGIGTTTVASLLALQTAARTTAYSASNWTTWADITVRNPVASTDINAATGIAFFPHGLVDGNAASGIAAVKSSASDRDSDLVFITRGAAVPSSEKMRITSAGNVGIGSTTPNAKLVVSGDVYLDGASRYLNFGTAAQGTNGYGIRDNGGKIEVKNSGGSWKPIQATSTQYARVSGGNTSTDTTVWTVMDVSVEGLDPSNISDTSTDKITPTEAGFYIASVSVRPTGTIADGTRVGAAVYVNGSLIASNTINLALVNTDEDTATVSAVFYVDGNDYIEARGYQNSGGTLNLALRSVSVGKIGGSDYAEYVMPETGTSPSDYLPGELLCLKASAKDTYGHCSGADDRNVIGVVSTNPGIIGNSAGSLQERDAFIESMMLPLSMVGRVPVRVSLEGGPIAIGDRITSSSEPGVGMKAGPFDPSVGRAVGNFTGDPAEGGIVEMYIDVQAGLSVASLTQELSQKPPSDSLAGQFLANLFTRITEWLASAGNGIAAIFATEVHAETVYAKKLCLEDVCITKMELQKMLDISGQASTSVQQFTTDDQSSNDQTSDVRLDTEAPAITINGANPAHLLVGDSYADLGASVTDNFDQNLGIHAFVNGVEMQEIRIDTSAVGEHTIIYRVTDGAGNVEEATRMVIVEEPAAPAPAEAPADSTDSTPSTSSGQASSPQVDSPQAETSASDEPAPEPEPELESEPTPTESTPAPEPMQEPAPAELTP